MLAVLDRSAPLSARAAVVRAIEDAGFRVQVSDTGAEHLIGVIGVGAERLADTLRALPGVREVRTVAPPYPRVARETHPESTTVRVGNVVVGGPDVVAIAGPCAVESEAQLMAAARAVAAAGAHMLRGGAFKPRTSPYAFQGLGLKGLELLAAAREATGLPVVTEIVAAEDVAAGSRLADVLQIGARNMQNFRLLEAVGAQGKPVLLKRGMMNTIEELLCAAEYIVNAGNPRVILCERGIRTFETATRNTLDVSAVPVLRQKSHLPVIVDPSHAAGARYLVEPLALAGIAAGADGIIVEVHPEPAKALCDGKQALTPDDFRALWRKATAVAAAVGRGLA